MVLWMSHVLQGMGRTLRLGKYRTDDGGIHRRWRETGIHRTWGKILHVFNVDHENEFKSIFSSFANTYRLYLQYTSSIVFCLEEVLVPHVFQKSDGFTDSRTELNKFPLQLDYLGYFKMMTWKCLLHPFLSDLNSALRLEFCDQNRPIFCWFLWFGDPNAQAMSS